jgi:hypothetical protein
MSIVEADLRQLKKAKDWRREDAADIFGTDGSWQWFKRIHYRELVESGAVIVRSGRPGDLIDLSRIGPVVREILHKKSLTHLNQQAA